jgi:anti-sigma factor RsiW
MADCSNVEIRELLPERASGALSVADLARVDAHVAGCAMCSDELALIRSARSALRREPRVDVARIAAAVQRATAAPARPALVGGGSRPARTLSRSRWIGWKAAAAVAIAAIGGGTMLFSSRIEAPTVGSSIQPVGTAPSSATPIAAPALNVAGGLNELSESDLQNLLDDIGALGVDAPSFEEPAAVLPDLADEEGLET